MYWFKLVSLSVYGPYQLWWKEGLYRTDLSNVLLPNSSLLSLFSNPKQWSIWQIDQLLYVQLQYLSNDMKPAVHLFILIWICHEGLIFKAFKHVKWWRNVVSIYSTIRLISLSNLKWLLVISTQLATVLFGLYFRFNRIASEVTKLPLPSHCLKDWSLDNNVRHY